MNKKEQLPVWQINPPTMTSREIAELVESRHDDVKRSIVRLAERGVIIQPPMADEQFTDTMGRPRTEQVYQVGKRDSYIVVAQLCPEFTARLVDRWQELEAQAAAPVMALPQDYIQALESLLASKKSERLAIEQRDAAIATKAQIGNRREATAMATASAAKKENAKLKARMGEATQHASVIAVEGKTKRRNFYNWRLLKNYCTANELDVGKSFNPGIQKDVNTYPAAAWFDVYGVVLGELFCEVAA